MDGVNTYNCQCPPEWTGTGVMVLRGRNSVDFSRSLGRLMRVLEYIKIGEES